MPENPTTPSKVCPACRKTFLIEIDGEQGCDDCGYHSKGFYEAKRKAERAGRFQRTKDGYLLDLSPPSPHEEEIQRLMKTVRIPRTLVLSAEHAAEEARKQFGPQPSGTPKRKEECKHSEPQASATKPNPQKAPPAPQPQKRRGRGRTPDINVAHRRTIIREIAATGVTGQVYADALDAKHLKPPPNWIHKEGCPRSYPDAYKQPKWAKRINREKSEYCE